MAISISAGTGFEALLGNAELEAAGAEGAEAAIPPQAIQNAAAAQSTFEPQQPAAKGKVPLSWSLDTSNIQDLIAPPSAHPCFVGPAAMTSNPGQLFELQLPEDQRSQLSGLSSAIAVAGSASDCTPEAAKPAAKPKPPPLPDTPSYLTKDPNVTAKETELRTNMFTPKENQDPNMLTGLAEGRFEIQSELTSKQQSQFQSDPASRARVSDAGFQKKFQADIDTDFSRFSQKTDERVKLQSQALTDAGYGSLVNTIKSDDDAAGGERGFRYQYTMSQVVTPLTTAAPNTKLGSPDVTNEVSRVLGPKAAAELPSLTPLQQATTYSQAVQGDLNRVPVGPIEGLNSDTPEDFMRDYTYGSPEKLQNFEDMPAMDRAELNRQAKSAQLYVQTSNAGTDWSAAITTDTYARNEQQFRLNDAALAAQAQPPKTSPFQITLPAGWVSATSGSVTRVGGAQTPAPGMVPPANGAPAVPDQFKQFVASKGLDVSGWDTMSVDQKAESVKAAYLFNLAGQAIAGVPIKP